MTRHPISVMMPYRPTPSRKPLQIAVTKWWESNFNITPIRLDSAHKIFNLAAVRNKCVDESPTEIVIVTDADIICEPKAIVEAVESVATTGNTCVPYNKHHVLTNKGTKNYLKGQDIGAQPHIAFESTDGGIVVTTKSMWQRHNGQDERFVGWGGEDICWALAYETLIGTLIRLDAIAWTMHHQPAPRNIDAENKNKLRTRYVEAQGDLAKMSQLIKGNR
jgi:hypothetical protein